MLKYFRIIAITFTVLILFWSAGLVWFCVHVTSLSISKAESGYTDAIIVLTGGAGRINTGLDLLAERKAKHLFISGVNVNVSVDQLVALWRKDVTAPPCCIVLGHAARNTFENAAEAQDWIALNNIKSVRLLTERYHMPRAWLEFKAVMPEMDIRSYAVTPRHTSRTMIMSEYNKTLLTVLRLKLMKVKS